MAYNQPNQEGFYGEFGGRFVPETLMTAVLELDKAYRESKKDPAFQAELDELLKQYVGRENPLYFAKNLTAYAGGAKIYLKREDLNHTGAHGWARKKSLQRLVRVSMEWPPPQLQPFSTWTVLSIWAKKMSSAKPSMSFGWNF